MNLTDALHQIADYAHLDADALIAYAAEDVQGGRGDGYDNWSIDADEGKVLFALVRALKPQQVIEIGVREGASTAHLLSAIDHNKAGLLDSYDVEANGKQGYDNWTFHQADALTVDFPSAEIVFEDSAHGLDYSLKVFERLKAFARVVVTHDTLMTPKHGDFHVRAAFETVFPDGLIFALDGCERGLGVWVNQEWAIAEHEAQIAYDKQQVAAPTSAPKKATAKRSTTRKLRAKKS